MTRPEKVAEAQRLRAEGLLLREIAERMGVACSTVDTWLSDPDLSKQRARRKRYAGRCKGCGRPTDGSGGAGAAPDICRSCLDCRNEERDRRIVAAWERGDQVPVIAGREGVSANTVRGVIEHRRRRHGEVLSLHRRRNRELWPLIERRWGEGATLREIAAETGSTWKGIGMMMVEMRRAGIDLPYRNQRAA